MMEEDLLEDMNPNAERTEGRYSMCDGDLMDTGDGIAPIGRATELVGAAGTNFWAATEGDPADAEQPSACEAVADRPQHAGLFVAGRQLRRGEGADFCTN